MTVDIADLSKDELKKLRGEVDKALTTFENRRRIEALKAVEQVAKEHGFKLSELMPQAAGRTGAKVAPQYANPEDPSQTWSGRGRKPRWFIAALEAGHSLADLKI